MARKRNNKTVQRGDFTVTEEDLAAAEDAYEERGAASRTRDEAFRAPIAPNRETWENNQHGLDYPGIDTPTERPRQAVYDVPLPGDTAGGGDIGVAVGDRDASVFEMKEEYDSSLDNLAEGVEDLFSL